MTDDPRAVLTVTASAVPSERHAAVVARLEGLAQWLATAKIADPETGMTYTLAVKLGQPEAADEVERLRAELAERDALKAAIEHVRALLDRWETGLTNLWEAASEERDERNRFRLDVRAAELERCVQQLRMTLRAAGPGAAALTTPTPTEEPTP